MYSVKKIPSALEDHLGFWLRQLSNQVSASFARRLEKYDVSVPQWVMLRVLFDHDGTTLLVWDGGWRHYITIDLPRSLRLQIF